MMNQCQKINSQEPQRNRNATANVVNLIRTSTVLPYIILSLKLSLEMNIFQTGGFLIQCTHGLIQSTLDITNSDDSNSAKLKASI